jgi:Cellulase (glycosyl hydrolase family 5)
VLKRVSFVALAALALAVPAHAGGPRMLVGATEDNVRQPTLPAAKANMDLLVLAGFNAVRVSQVWAPGETSLTPEALAPLQNAVEAARLAGVEVVLTVTQFGSRTTPLTDEQQAQFAAFSAWLAKTLPSVRRIIVSNEPNLNRYWLPQFNEDGTDAAAPAYESLLAKTYDALKAADPKLQVVGGGLAPRGIDRPNTGRDTHSPTAFIHDLGAAYRLSGRTTAIMDALAIHPYEDNSSVAPVDGTHPTTSSISLADYDKLVTLLGEAFGGTAQPGSTLPILYDEFGVETQTPAEELAKYTGTEPVATVRPVDTATQARFYKQALQLTFCQPNVEGIFLFHTVDETALLGWQSGLYYVDGTPKPSLAPTRAAVAQVHRDTIASCPGLQVTPKLKLSWVRDHAFVTCDVDCNYRANLVGVPRRAVASRGGRIVANHPTLIQFRTSALRRGRYRVELRLTAVLNAAAPLVRLGPIFSR